MKKVLYISYDGMTDPLGQSQVLPYLVQLSKEGYRFTVISFEKKQRFEKEAGIIRSITQQAGIEWVPLRFTAKPPVLSKMYDRYQMWQTAFRLYQKHKFELVHCRSYVAAEVGLRLKKRFGTGFLFDMRGFWADEKVDNGQWDLNNPFYRRIYRHYKQKEREFLLNADGIISLTQAGKNYLLQQPGYEHLSIEVIPCCADLDHFDYRQIDQQEGGRLKRELDVPEHAKLVTYLGSIGGWYMTKEMFDFFKRLADKDPAYHMLILTKDAPEAVRREAGHYGIPLDKITVTYSERKTLPLYLSLSLFSIFFIRNSFSKIASSPTKHAELMGMGIPVICNDIGDTGIIIERTGTGLLVNSFDEKGINAAIGQLDQLLSLDRQSIRNCALEFFDLRSGARKYLQVYRHILKQDQPTTVSLHA